MNELVQKIQAGDRNAFRDLYEKEKVRLYNLALRLVGNPSDAQDCLQDAMVKVFRNIKQFQFQSAFSTWVYRIVINTCSSYRSKQTVNSEWIEELYGKQDPDWSLKQRLETAVQQLDEAHRTVFILYEIEGFNHPEIADLLDISEGTSKSRLSRAKARLREDLKDLKYEFT